MSTATVKNAADTWVNQSLPTKNYNTKARLWLNATGGAAKQAFMFFNRPFQIPTNVYVGKLRIYSAESWTGATTITVRLVAAKWNVNKLTYNNAPTVGGGSVTVASGGTTPAGTLFEVDVTTLLQTIAAGGQQWYGFRITTSQTTTTSIHSAQSPNGALRPALYVSWGDAPDEPGNLKPSNGRVVASGAPVLTWDFSDIAGDQNLGAIQVQQGASQALLDAGTTTWDSLAFPTTEPQIDLSTLLQPAAFNGGLETNITGWTGTNTTLAQGTAQFRTGSKSLQSTSASTSQPLIESDKYPVIPGVPVSGGGYSRAAVTARGVQCRIRWYDAAQAFISDSAIGNSTNTTSGWTQVLATGVAPAGAAYYSIMFNVQVTVASEVHYFDDMFVSWGLGLPFTALTNGSTTWWRCRNQDGAGLWSPWADSVQFGYTTPITVSNFLINGSSVSIQDASPVATWTTSVRTQKAFQLLIMDAIDPNTIIWDSGKQTTTQQYCNVPFGVLVDAQTSYIFALRVWDDQSREAVPGIPVYVETRTAALPFAYSGAVTNVTSLAMSSDPILPKATLTFNAATAPDYFEIQRSDDNGATWYWYDEVVPSEIFVSGTSYSWVDNGAKQYIQHQWRVFRSVGGVVGTGAVVSGVVARLCPVLMRRDGTDACFFMNPERDRQRLSIQGVHERMGGPPVLVTQKIGGQGGHVKGRFVDEAPGGTTYTAKNQRANFLDLEKDSGQKMVLAIANETLNVVAFNFNLDVITDTQGVTYLAEFDWIQVP